MPGECGDILLARALRSCVPLNLRSCRYDSHLASLMDPIRAFASVACRLSMLIDAAVGGQGVALARTALTARDIINGRLVRPIDVSLRMSNTYWIVCPKVTSSVPKIATFRNWLLAEAVEDARRLRTLAS